LQHHQALFREDTKRQELIKQKQAEAQKNQAAPKKQETSGATVEEIDDAEAKRI